MPKNHQAGSPQTASDSARIIGRLNESALHAALKQYCAHHWGRLGGRNSAADSRFEVDIDGFIVDVEVAGQLIEVQTRNLAAARRKLERLGKRHPLLLVLPITLRKWIVKHHPDGTTSRRASPRRGDPVELFAELVSAPALLEHPNIAIELLLIHEEEHRVWRPRRARRKRGWSTRERKLLEVTGHRRLDRSEALLDLLPTDLPEPFTTLDLAVAGGFPRRLAQQAAYCLRQLELLRREGKRGRAYCYRFGPRAHAWRAQQARESTG